jgi:hypothetical protein
VRSKAKAKRSMKYLSRLEATINPEIPTTNAKLPQGLKFILSCLVSLGL